MKPWYIEYWYMLPLGALVNLSFVGLVFLLSKIKWLS